MAAEAVTHRSCRCFQYGVGPARISSESSAFLHRVGDERGRGRGAGCTSQPSIGAIINGLAGSEADTGIKPDAILPLITYWEQTRGLYAPFEVSRMAQPPGASTPVPPLALG